MFLKSLRIELMINQEKNSSTLGNEFELYDRIKTLARAIE